MSNKAKRDAYMARVRKHAAQREGMAFNARGERLHVGWAAAEEVRSTDKKHYAKTATRYSAVPTMTQEPHVRFSPPTQREVQAIQEVRSREAAQRATRSEEARSNWSKQAEAWAQHIAAHESKTFGGFSNEAPRFAS
jgi:hypothetical protein